MQTDRKAIYRFGTIDTVVDVKDYKPLSSALFDLFFDAGSFVKNREQTYNTIRRRNCWTFW